jgi:hypothetical protein
LARRQLAADRRTRVILINGTIAIVIDAIAFFYDAGINGCITVVAVIATADLRRVTVFVFIEGIKCADRACRFALDICFAGVVLPGCDALISGGTCGSRNAPAVERAVLARRTCGRARARSDGVPTGGVHAGVDGACMAIITVLCAGA